MPAYNIKGITVEIGGDTKNFNTALDELNRKVNSSATEIGKLNRLLKLDPSNTVLLTQKQGLLTKEIAASKDKLAALTQAKEQCSKTMQNGTESEQAEYRKLCAEIEETKLRMPYLQKTLDGITAGMAIMVNGPQLAGAGAAPVPATKTINYNQTINVTSPDPVSPAETARATRIATRDLISKIKG